MKLAKSLLTAGLLIGLMTGCTTNRSAIITVNGEPITKGQYETMLKRQIESPQFKQLGPEAKNPNGFMMLMAKDRIANELIVKALIEQQVKEHKITVSEDDIKAKRKEIAEKMGFQSVFPVSGQTYARKLDTQVLYTLAGIAQSAYKFSNDLRLLQHLKEIEEPFEKNQIGSSAMAYKRNPMRSERIGSLARYVICDTLNPAITASTQWFERTLDDSANKRISIPEGFLAVDAILELYINVVSGLVVYPKMIEKRLNDELPFMATENIMMAAVKKGGDRQELHERIRQHSMAAGQVVKAEGKPNDLPERIAADPAFGMTLEEIRAEMVPQNFIGRAPQQVTEFLKNDVRPILDKYKDLLGLEVEINV